ncbi:MAG: ZIP family metal transporter [Gammaproteobacteria bacterium]
MTFVEFKIFSALLILVIAIIAGWYPFYKHMHIKDGKRFPYAEAIAAGVFLGAGLLHMLGDAAQEFQHTGIEYPIPFFLAGLTFLFLLWLEHLGQRYANNESIFSFLATFMLSIHAFLAGSALGLSEGVSVASLILVAILAHKWAASFALAVHINKSELPISTGMILFGVFALTTPIGVIFGSALLSSLHAHSILIPIFNSLAAGTFLYLGTLHGLNRAAMIRCCNLKQFSMVIIGFLLMALVALWT